LTQQAQNARILRIDAAFHAGDLAALRAAVDDPGVVPNGPMPLAIGTCLVYAIYHSPLAFIRELLEMGADPKPDVLDGFPPLIAALCCSRDHPGSRRRDDVLAMLALLLEFGADPDQRGINDHTSLHIAVQEHNLPALELLLAAGANANARTRIDDYQTPRELAITMGLHDHAAVLEQYE
jgi:ankyrin repeat protein